MSNKKTTDNRQSFIAPLSAAALALKIISVIADYIILFIQNRTPDAESIILSSAFLIPWAVWAVYIFAIEKNRKINKMPAVIIILFMALNIGMLILNLVFFIKEYLRGMLYLSSMIPTFIGHFVYLAVLTVATVLMLTNNPKKKYGVVIVGAEYLLSFFLGLIIKIKTVINNIMSYGSVAGSVFYMFFSSVTEIVPILMLLTSIYLYIVCETNTVEAAPTAAEERFYQDFPQNDIG